MALKVRVQRGAADSAKTIPQETPQPSEPKVSRKVWEPRTTKVLVLHNGRIVFVNSMMDMGEIKKSIREQKAWFCMIKQWFL